MKSYMFEVKYDDGTGAQYSPVPLEEKVLLEMLNAVEISMSENRNGSIKLVSENGAIAIIRMSKIIDFVVSEVRVGE